RDSLHGAGPIDVQGGRLSRLSGPITTRMVVEQCVHVEQIAGPQIGGSTSSDGQSQIGTTGAPSSFWLGMTARIEARNPGKPPSLLSFHVNGAVLSYPGTLWPTSSRHGSRRPPNSPARPLPCR